MNAIPDPFAAIADKEVKILPPDYSLKEKIGSDVNMSMIFTPEVIENAQKSIDKHKDSFIAWVAIDMAALEAHFLKAAASNPPSQEEMKQLESIAARIKAQAGTFGFGLATLVAKSLCNFCNAHAILENAQLVVIRKHIDTLMVIFNRKITGDGGKIGDDLLDNLSKLTKKYN